MARMELPLVLALAIVRLPVSALPSARLSLRKVAKLAMVWLLLRLSTAEQSMWPAMRLRHLLLVVTWTLAKPRRTQVHHTAENRRLTCVETPAQTKT